MFSFIILNRSAIYTQQISAYIFKFAIFLTSLYAKGC